MRCQSAPGGSLSQPSRHLVLSESFRTLLKSTSIFPPSPLLPFLTGSFPLLSPSSPAPACPTHLNPLPSSSPPLLVPSLKLFQSSWNHSLLKRTRVKFHSCLFLKKGPATLSSSKIKPSSVCHPRTRLWVCPDQMWCTLVLDARALKRAIIYSAIRVPRRFGPSVSRKPRCHTTKERV